MIIFFLLFSSLLLAQNDSPVIQVNDHFISVHEFSSRLNNLPQKSKTNIVDVKEDLICSLIAEAILADQAQKKLTSNDKISLLNSQYHNETLYEQWMETEIRSKVKVTDSELQKAFPYFRELRIVEFITYKDSLHPAADTQTKTLEFGESLPEIETAVFSLKKDEQTQPIFIDSLYYVFRLKDIKPHTDHSKEDFNYWKPSLEQIIRQRKEKVILDARLLKLMKGKDFTINKDAFNFLHDQLYPIIYGKGNPNAETPEIIQSELTAALNSSKSFDEVLIIFQDGKQWTVREFWKQLAVSPYPLNYKNPYDLKPGLHDIIQRTILLEVVSRDAAAKQFGSSNYVTNESHMWSRNIYASAFLEEQKSFVKNSESDLISYYDSNKDHFIKPELYRIIPILVKDKPLAEDIYKRIINGADILSLAGQFSLNKQGLNSSNLGIYLTKDSWGPAGKSLSQLSVGEISPPIRMDDGSFAVIKLLEIKNSVPYTYDEIRDKLNLLLTDIKVQQAVSSFLEKAVSNYNIKINRKAIELIEYYGGDMVVKKMHFPLRNIAPGFPVFNHKSKWYQSLF